MWYDRDYDVSKLKIDWSIFKCFRGIYIHIWVFFFLYNNITIPLIIIIILNFIIQFRLGNEYDRRKIN